MTVETLNSAAVLRTIWARYADGYEKTHPRRPTMREVSRDLAGRGGGVSRGKVDESLLSKWMSVDAPVSRRVPLREIPALRTALMMTVEELDELMIARLNELAEDHEVTIASDWLFSLLERLHSMSQEEKIVLDVFRAVREQFPMGMQLDVGERTIMTAQMQVLLERAQENEFERRSLEDDPPPEERESVEGHLARLASQLKAGRGREVSTGRKAKLEVADVPKRRRRRGRNEFVALTDSAIASRAIRSP